MYGKKGADKRIRSAAAGLLLVFMLMFLSACSGQVSENAQTAAVPAADQSGRTESGNTVSSVAPAAAPALNMTSAGEAGSVPDAAPNTVHSAASAPALAAGTGHAGGISPIAGLEAGLNRKVIYKANVTMRVEDYDRAEAELQDAIHLSGAYILQFSNSIEAKIKSANYVIKVPADGLSSFIDRLREIEKNLQIQMEGSDVTEEYVDLEARLQAKKATEARLLAFMEKASSADDLVRFSSELNNVQEQIEQLKGRMRYIDQNVAYSTVHVRLYEIGDKAARDQEPPLGQRMTDALKGSAEAMGQFGQALLIFLAALLPVAAILALIGIPLYLIVRSSQRRRKNMLRNPASASPEITDQDAQKPQ